MESIAKIRHLSLTFDTPAGRAEVLRDISFDIPAGECVAVVGESGCGKSATAKTIMGLHRESGTIIGEDSRIEFDGKDILKFSRKEWQKFRGNQASMIFQDAMSSLNPTMKIGEQIAEAVLIHQGKSRREALEIAIELLGQTGVVNPRENAGRYPFEFSGGMRQRAMIAMAVACNPRLLIADEPTTALDVTIQTQILQLIKEQQVKRKTSVLFITHNLGIVAGIAQRVLVMYNGKIVEAGKVEDVFYHPMHPYTRALLRSTLRMDTEKEGRRLYCIEGAPPGIMPPPPGCPFTNRCPHAMNVCAQYFPPEHREQKGQTVWCWRYWEKGKSDGTGNII